MVYQNVLPLARCPDCLGALSLRDAKFDDAPLGEGGAQVLSGTLACACGKAYPIVDGIPVLCQP